MGIQIAVTQPHSLGRMEAKQRIAEKTTALIAQHPDWGLSGSWTDNVYNYTASSGLPAGSSGAISVRNNQVDMTMTVPDQHAAYVDMIRQSMQSKLANALS